MVDTSFVSYFTYEPIACVENRIDRIWKRTVTVGDEINLGTVKKLTVKARFELVTFNTTQARKRRSNN